MSEIDITAGTVLSLVLGPPATYDSVGFEALTLIEVGEVGAIPEFGGEAQVGEFTPVKTGTVNKRPGSINYGSFTVPLAMLYGDEGQDLCQSGFDGANTRKVHSIGVEKAGVGAIYYTAVITAYKFNLGDANQISQASVTFNLTGKPLPVAAGAAV